MNARWRMNQLLSVAVRQMAKAGTLPSYLDLREIQLGEPLSLEISDFEEQQKKTRQRRKSWDIRVRFPSSDEKSDESFPDNETAYDDGPSIVGTRDSFSLRKTFPASEKAFASTAQLCSIDFFLYFPFYGSNGIAVTFLCFMHLLTLLFVSLVTCLYYYVLPRPKFNGRKSLPWLPYVICAKLWKLLKWTISMWAKTPTDQCWMRKSSPTEKALLRWGNGIKQKSMIGIGIGRYKQSGLGDRE